MLPEEREDALNLLRIAASLFALQGFIASGRTIGSAKEACDLGEQLAREVDRRGWLPGGKPNDPPTGGAA